MMGECGSSSVVEVEEGDAGFDGGRVGGEDKDGGSGEGRDGARDDDDGGGEGGPTKHAAKGDAGSSSGGNARVDAQGAGGEREGGGAGRRQVDFVMCCGHFLGRDEDIFEYIERCSSARIPGASPSPSRAAKGKGKEKIEMYTKATRKSGAKGGGGARGGAESLAGEKKKGNGRDKAPGGGAAGEAKGGKQKGGERDGRSSSLSAKGRPPIANDGKQSTNTTFGTPITCTVGRKRSGASYYVNDSDDVAELLATLTNSLDDGKGRVELLQFDGESSMGSSLTLADLARQSSVANMANLSRQGSVADVARMGRNQSMSNMSNHSSELQFQHTTQRRPEEMVVPPSPISSPAPY